MPSVQSETLVDAPLDRVYAIAQDNESFPEFMDDLKSLEIVERDGGRIVSDWVGTVPSFGLKLKWRQEDVWDDEKHACAFRQLEGDYDKLEGTWRFSDEGGKTRFSSDLEYEYKVPGLGPLVAKVIHKIVQKNVDDILAAIKGRAEQAS